MTHLLRTNCAAAIALAFCGNLVHAQDLQDDQRFRIRVPGVVSINATNHSAHIIHDFTENFQRFDWQPWQVVCNNAAGAVVTFETDQPFTHTTQPSVKRDVFLFLSDSVETSVFPREAWRVRRATDETNYKSGYNVAKVWAEVDAPQDAKLHLKVEFLEENFAETIAGDYELTVTGTITPK